MNNLFSKKEKTYRHYGHASFQKELFSPVSNGDLLPKPKGGFWASRTNSSNGWDTWCREEEFEDIDELIASKEYFDFRLSPDSKILVIDSKGSLETAATIYGKDIKKKDLDMIFLDFEKIAKDFDAVEVLISKDYKLYSYLYGWDCDSICIMNPDIIQAKIKEKDLDIETFEK